MKDVHCKYKDVYTPRISFASGDANNHNQRISAETESDNLSRSEIPNSYSEDVNSSEQPNSSTEEKRAIQKYIESLLFKFLKKYSYRS